jgi:hypothetical protein
MPDSVDRPNHRGLRRLRLSVGDARKLNQDDADPCCFLGAIPALMLVPSLFNQRAIDPSSCIPMSTPSVGLPTMIGFFSRLNFTVPPHLRGTRQAAPTSRRARLLLGEAMRLALSVRGLSALARDGFVQLARHAGEAAPTLLLFGRRRLRQSFPFFLVHHPRSFLETPKHRGGSLVQTVEPGAAYKCSKRSSTEPRRQ